MKAKRLAIFSCIIGACLITTVATSVSCRGSDAAQIDNPVSESRYNLNPDVSGKFIASRYTLIDRHIPRILEDVLYSSTCVIIGEVIDFESATGFISTIDQATARVKVIETIIGEHPVGDIILYRLYSTSEYHSHVKNGEIYVFMLVYFEDLDQYAPALFEESAWYIDGENKLTSKSDMLICAKYDGIDLSILVEDIHEMWAKKDHFK